MIQSSRDRDSKLKAPRTGSWRNTVAPHEHDSRRAAVRCLLTTVSARDFAIDRTIFDFVMLARIEEANRVQQDRVARQPSFGHVDQAFACAATEGDQLRDAITHRIVPFGDICTDDGHRRRTSSLKRLPLPTSTRARSAHTAPPCQSTGIANVMSAARRIANARDSTDQAFTDRPQASQPADPVVHPSHAVHIPPGSQSTDCAYPKVLT